MNLDIPEYYLNWVSSLDLEDPITYKGKDWYLYSQKELMEETIIDSQTTPNYLQLQSFLNTQREVTGEAPLSNEEAMECITIGESNGNPLFYTPKDSALWCYYVDGGDIEQVSVSLQSFIEKSVVE